MRKQSKLSWVLMLASVIIVGILSFSSAYAYFSDKVNTGGSFTLGKLQIALKEGTKTVETFAIVEDMLPGTFLLGDKDNYKSLTIDLTNTTIESYLRVKASGSLSGIEGSDDMFDIILDDKWYLHTDGYYYQTNNLSSTTSETQAIEVAPTTNSVTLNIKIQFKTSVEGAEYMKKAATYGIIVEAIQANYLESTDPNYVYTISGLAGIWGGMVGNTEDIFVITGGTMSGLTDYGKTLTYLNVPSGVTTISADAFKGNKTLKTVVMNDSVETIGEGAFRDCTNLQSVTLSNSTTTIGKNAFNGCKGLTNISIPSSVSSIGAQVFMGCTSLKSVIIPNSVTSLGNTVFGACSNLESVTLPNTITSIPKQTFRMCTSLKAIEIPDSVKIIGENAFRDCTSLESVILSDNLEKIEKSGFAVCSSLTEIHTPDSLTEIGDTAFSNCSKLQTVTLSNNITNIGAHAFNNCSELSNINIPTSLKYLGQYAFQEAGITSINLPEGLLYIGNGAFNHCDSVNQTTITIPSTVVQIGGASYTGNNLEVGTHVFYDCATTKLTAFAVASGNTNYKAVDGVLYSSNNKYLVAYPPAKTSTEYTILDGCVQIYECAFSRAHYLLDLTLPATLKLEHDSTFTVPSTFLNEGYNPLYGGTYKYTSIENYHIATNDNYVEVDGIIYNKSVTKAIAVPNRNWKIVDGKKVLEFEDSCTVIGNVLSRNNDPEDSVSSEQNFSSHMAGGYPNIIKIGANITEIDIYTLDYFNALVDLGVTIQLDAGNTAYTLSNNKLVKAG